MARLLVNDPVYILMRNAASDKFGSNNFPAFIAVLEFANYWLDPDSNTKHTHFHNFIQLIFNKDNYSKDANGLQGPLHYEQQTVRKDWKKYKSHFLRDYCRYKSLPTQLLISRYILFIFDRDFCKALYPYHFLTLESLKTFLSQINLPEPDKKFYDNILLSQNDIKPYSYEELYNEVAITEEK